MKKVLSASILVLAMCLFTASAGFATSVMVNGTTYYTANAATTYGLIAPSTSSSDGYPNNINIVDWLLNYGGDYTLVTPNWNSDGASSIMLAEIAGNASSNTFGYYIGSGATLDREVLFSGGASVNSSASFTLTPAQSFGFYLGVPSGAYYYTDNPYQAAVFQNNNNYNEYIIGFEDLSYYSSDKDFQDMIVKATINDAAPVPEPATMLLLGSGLLGLAGFRKKIKK